MSPESIKAFGYVRVSSKEQEDNPRYNHQEIAIQRFADCKQWDIRIFREVRSGKNIHKRQVLMDVLERLKRGEAQYLIVYHVDRLTRSQEDGMAIFRASQSQGWTLYPMNIPPDQILHSEFWLKLYQNCLTDAQYELGVLSRRTKEGIEKSPNRDKLGARLFPTYSDETIKRVKYLRSNRKLTLRRIAEILNEEGNLPPRSSIFHNQWDLFGVRKLCEKFSVTK
jgi:DNA invertase Pin-like site-specific DNA recombinase